MRNTKKGFTLVELLVVIAILAILATVSVVGYTSFINRANISADEQAVTQMNTVLTAEGVLNGGPVDVSKVRELLVENGYNGAFETVYAKYKFGWLKNDGVVVLAEFENNTIAYPEKYKGESTDRADFSYFNVAVVNSVAELIEEINNIGKLEGHYATIVLNGNINLESEQTLTINDTTSVKIDLNGNTLEAIEDAFYVEGTGSLEICGGTIKSAADVGYATGKGTLLISDATIEVTKASGYSIVTNGHKSLGSKIVLDNVTILDKTQSGSSYLYIPAGDVTIKNSYIEGRVCVSGGNVVFENTEFVGTGSSAASGGYRAEEDAHTKAVGYINSHSGETITFGDVVLVIFNRGGKNYKMESFTATNCKFTYRDGLRDDYKAFGLRIVDMKNGDEQVDPTSKVTLSGNTYSSYENYTGSGVVYQNANGTADYNDKAAVAELNK